MASWEPVGGAGGYEKTGERAAQDDDVIALGDDEDETEQATMEICT